MINIVNKTNKINLLDILWHIPCLTCGSQICYDTNQCNCSTTFIQIHSNLFTYNNGFYINDKYHNICGTYSRYMFDNIKNLNICVCYKELTYSFDLTKFIKKCLDNSIKNYLNKIILTL